MSVEFRPARPEELEAVLSLYREARAGEFCVWDDEYPTRREAEGDLAAGCLYVLTEEAEVIGVLSVIPERELDGLAEWRFSGEDTRELGRITVSSRHHGKGYAGYMVRQIAERLQRQGVKALHISAAVCNLPALRTYEKLGFCNVARLPLYGGEYLLLEKLL